MNLPSFDVKLSEVARLAGVSDITVSRVLRGTGAVADATRERVLEAVRRTGYIHNRLAGALASASSNLVGVILPSLTNNVFPEVIEGINAALADSSLHALVGVSHYDMAQEEALIASTLAWKPAGFILAGLRHNAGARTLLANTRTRVVEIMETDGEALDTAIGFSHRAAGAATAQHLLDKGYKRFGYVGHDILADYRAGERYDSLCDTLWRLGLPRPAEVRLPGPSSIAAGREGLSQLLSSNPDCDVVVFSNDDMAVGGVFHCLATGIVPRRDLGLFGFNGLDIGQSLPTPLSTIRSSRQSIGAQAVKALLSSRERPASPILIDTGFDIVPGATA